MRSADLSPQSSEAPDFDCLEEAAQWFALLRSDEVTEQDRSRWQEWLDQHASHRAAWQHVESVGRRFQALQSDKQRRAAGKALQSASGLQRSRRRALGAIAVVSAAGVLGSAVVNEARLRRTLAAWRADYSTATGEVREFTLADGTHVWLNTASALDVDYRPSLRRLRLIEGEVLIETAHGAGAPFVVDTEHGRLHALGTRFSVRQFEDATLVAVYSGVVEVRTANGGRTQVIEADHQARFTRDVIGPVEQAGRAGQAWARGVLLAENIPLRELVAELARYRRGHLSCAPEVAEIRVMGAYPLNDPDRVLAMLESALPVRVQRTLPWWITIQARS
ncbi:MAG: FecR domain-containing protein [Burkholderiales bacterium]|nr:FecR domain-containing protein [Burkholderiales bacterium]MCW5621486.1 FecR domain-containing protein [Burkholderiales bacterium]